MFYAFIGGLSLGISGSILIYNFYKVRKKVSLQPNATTGSQPDPSKEEK